MVDKLKVYEFSGGKLDLTKDNCILKDLYKKMSILMNVSPKKINLFSYNGKYSSIDINKDLYINPDILNAGVHYIKSSVTSKHLNKDHPKFKKIMDNYENFKKYIICQLHEKDIFCNSLGGCGIHLGDYKEGFVFPDRLEVIGDYFYFDGGQTSLELKALIDNLETMSGHTSLELKALKEELEIIGKITNVFFNVFEEINNPRLTITDAFFVDEDKEIEYKENELITSLNIDYALRNIEVERAFNNIEFKLKRDGIY